MGNLTSALERLKAEGMARHRAAFEAWVRDTQSRAMRHAREGGSHPYGTPTPASKGGGPAVVTGGLARGTQATDVVLLGDTFTARVGVVDEPHEKVPPKSRRRRSSGRRPAPSVAQVGEYVEKMGYPFLSTAAKEAEATAEAIWVSSFEGMS